MERVEKIVMERNWNGMLNSNKKSVISIRA